jgi:hypothetical protein
MREKMVADGGGNDNGNDGGRDGISEGTLVHK